MLLYVKVWLIVNEQVIIWMLFVDFNSMDDDLGFHLQKYNTCTFV